MKKILIISIFLSFFAIFANDFPECKEYMNLVCETCGSDSQSCVQGKARLDKCIENKNCQTSVCKDSLNYAKTGNKDTVKQLMCTVRDTRK